jgi:hypothetical protein
MNLRFVTSAPPLLLLYASLPPLLLAFAALQCFDAI